MAATGGVTTGTTFNNPQVAADQNTILDHLADLIQGAVPGSTIQLSVMVFGSDWLANLLVGAKNRGVTVQIILPSASLSNSEGARTYNNILSANFPAYTPSLASTASWVLICKETATDHACLAKDTDPAESTYTGVDHNKFYLFSSTSGVAGDVTDATNDVVLQTSANLTVWDRQQAYNDALTIASSKGLYDAYASYFDQLRDAGYDPSLRQPNGPPAVQAGWARVYFFPRNDGTDGSADDTVVNVLDAVDDPVGSNAICAGNSNGYGNSSGHTLIQISMHQITRPAVAQKLWELQNDGCQVQIDYAQLDESGTTVCDQLIKSTAHGSIRLKQLTGSFAVHDKFLLIDGAYQGIANQKVVFMGSETYTKSALHANDEVMLKWDDTDDPSIFDAYQSDFTTVSDATGIKTTTSCPA